MFTVRGKNKREDRLLRSKGGGAGALSRREGSLSPVAFVFKEHDPSVQRPSIPKGATGLSPGF
jgi:hypothetical protein